VTEGVTVSTFGLGDDFDEDTMRGIAERGSGDYYFIETPVHIVPCVQRAFQVLVGLVGTNGYFKVFSENATKIVEIYGPENPDSGYSFGDINSSGTRNVLVALEVFPEINQLVWEVLRWELSFKSTTTPSQNQVICGTLQLNCTTDHELLQDEDNEVVLAIKVKEFGKKDKECKILLDQNKIAETISLKKSMLSELREFELRDKSGRIQKLIEISEKALESLTEEDGKIQLQQHQQQLQQTREPVLLITNPGGLPTIFESHRPHQQSKLRLVPKKKPVFSKKVARKYFDSGDYRCRNDNSHNWDS